MSRRCLELFLKTNLIKHCWYHPDRGATYQQWLIYYCDECGEAVKARGHEVVETDYADAVREMER